MKVIICLDDNNGLYFNKRRQSRDQVVITDIKELGIDDLLIEEYSLELFDNSNIETTVVENIFSDIKNNRYRFVERTDIAPFVDMIETVVLYKWNRIYPSDESFDVKLDELAFEKESETDFIGKSHDKITREIWRKNK